MVKLPVVDGGSEIDYWLRHKDSVSAVVIAASGMGIEDVPKLAEFQKPIYLLDPPEELFEIVKTDTLIRSFFRFVPADELTKTSESVASWVWLVDRLLDHSKEDEAVTFTEPSDGSYRFTHTGWSFMRLGYALDWRCKSEKPCTVKQVSPGFIAVQSEGEVTVQFKKPDTVYGLMVVAGVGTGMVLLLPFLARFWQKKFQLKSQEKSPQRITQTKKQNETQMDDGESSVVWLCETWKYFKFPDFWLADCGLKGRIYICHSSIAQR
jgi:hypothetical protein